MIKHIIDDFGTCLFLAKLGSYKVGVFGELSIHFMNSRIENKFRNILVNLRKNPVFY